MERPSDNGSWIEEDEVPGMSDRDPNKFLEAEAKAVSLDIFKKEAKEKAKKGMVKTQGGKAPINIERMKKRWGKWYVFGLNENGENTAKCKACSSWYVGINKKVHSNGKPLKGYEYAQPHVIRDGKQKLGWDGHLKDQKNAAYSSRAHWRAVRGLEKQHKFVYDQAEPEHEVSTAPMSSSTPKRFKTTPLRMIELKSSDISEREIERRKRGLEVLCRMAYVIAKADMPISKFSILRNIVQQSQLTMLGDSHERVRAISNRLNDFFAVVETQLHGLQVLVDSNLPKKDGRQRKLDVMYGKAVRNLSWSVMTNAIKDLE